MSFMGNNISALPTNRVDVSRHPWIVLISIGFIVLLLSTVARGQTTINVNGANGGRTFDGIGAISGGGGNSRLLIDYPSAQQSQILDYLFKPGVGANIQVLKVEIGGGNDSTSGSESTHEPVQGDIDTNTGYEWWLMEQAQARNPNIKFYALAWTAPGWVGGWFNNNSITYLADWLTCAASHGLTINYLGGLNEDNGDGTAAWWEQLRSTLDSKGFTSTQFVGGDQIDSFNIASSLLDDPSWSAVIPIISAHYPMQGGDGGNAYSCPTFSAALSTGKPMWQSEGGSQDYNQGAPVVIRSITRGYIDGSMTLFNNWPLIAATYPDLPYDTEGLAEADQPWSGWYSIGATTWAIAQVTQFAQPGWTFINSASGYLSGNEQNGTYVTLKSPNGTDYSTIIETTTATAAQTVTLNVGGGLSTGTVHVWATNLGSSNPANWFVQQPNITPSGGSYSLTLQPNCIYSITTTSGQGKGTATSPAPAEMSLPYSDSFSGYPTSSTAKYLAQVEGDFESQPCVGQGGNCIEQVLPDAPSQVWMTGLPWAVLGDLNWSDYTVSVDARLQQSGTVYLAGLVNSTSGKNTGSYPNNFNGYSIQVNNTGNWILYDDSANNNPTTLASGSIAAPGVDTWISLAMGFNGSHVSASINGDQVASVNNSDHQSGQVGFGILGWQVGQFSNLSITPGTPAYAPTAIVPFISVSGAWTEESGATVTTTSAVVNLGPQPATGGSWSWIGPGGFTSTAREIDKIPLTTGVNTFVATYTNAGGIQSTQTFTITVTGALADSTDTVTNSTSDLVWDDPSNSTTSGTNVELWQGNGYPNQQWTFTSLGGNYYEIVNAYNGLALNDPGSSTTAGTLLIQYPYGTGSTNAQWLLTPSGSGYVITNKASGLAVDPNANASSSYLQLEPASGAASQVWTIDPVSVSSAPTAIVPFISVSGAWTEESGATVTTTSAVVNLGPQPVTGGSWSWIGPGGFTSTAREIDEIPLTTGANSFVATYTNADGIQSTQTFTIIVTGALVNGTYTVTNSASDLVWDDPSNGTTSGTDVDLWQGNGYSNQQWTFTSLGGGYYEIVNAYNGLALNDPTSSTTAGTLLIQYPYGTGSTNAQWLLTPSGSGYVITNKASGLAVDPNANASSSDLQQEPTSGDTSQVWIIN